MHDRSRPLIPPGLALFTAVVAMSFAGPLVRFTDAPPLAIASWRLVISVGIVAAALLLSRRGAPAARLGRADVVRTGIAGVLLAAHFWSWITSLAYTSVASSVVLVSTQPIFVALLSAVTLRERPDRRQWVGIGLAVAGAVVIGAGDFGRGPNPALGDALAVAGAVFGSGYFVIGRSLRPRLGLWAYTGVVYGVAAVALVAAALGTSTPLTGYAASDWLVFVLLAAGPMMLGHTGVNYALRFIPAYVANLAVLAEAVGATLLAWALPRIGETPPAQTLVGGAITLVGIAIGVRKRESADANSHGIPEIEG